MAIVEVTSTSGGQCRVGVLATDREGPTRLLQWAIPARQSKYRGTYRGPAGAVAGGCCCLHLTFRDFQSMDVHSGGASAVSRPLLDKPYACLTAACLLLLLLPRPPAPRAPATHPSLSILRPTPTPFNPPPLLVRQRTQPSQPPFRARQP